MREKIKKVLPEIDLIENPSIREATYRAWEIALEAAKLAPDALNELPFSLLAKKSGITLAEHIRAVTLSALCLAERMLSAYKARIKIDRNLLISGALVHDIGKVLECERGEAGFVKSSYGTLLRHPFSGVWICERAGLPAEVLHIVAVHSKEGEGGFRSVEAIIVYHCDFANFEPFRD